jgi:hypothetical protein
MKMKTAFVKTKKNKQKNIVLCISFFAVALLHNNIAKAKGTLAF